MGRATNHTNLRIYSLHHHMRYTIVIMEEVNCTYTHFSACDVFVPWEGTNRRYPNNSLCLRVVERKQQRLVEEEAWVVDETAFRAYGYTLEMVTSFCYLGRILINMDDDWTEVIEFF